MLESPGAVTNLVKRKWLPEKFYGPTSGGHCHDFLVNRRWVLSGNRNWDFLLLKLALNFFIHSFDHANKWQEVNDLRSTAVKLVSRLAQIPSSAIHFKDVLLSMPPLHRQQLQVLLCHWWMCRWTDYWHLFCSISISSRDFLQLLIEHLNDPDYIFWNGKFLFLSIKIISSH